MVQITRHIPLKSDESVDTQQWLKQLQWHYPGKSFQAIEQALEWAQTQGDFALSEIPVTAYRHGVEIAAVLTDLNADYHTIVAGLLFPLCDSKVIAQEEVVQQFGREIWQLLTGIQQVKSLQLLQHKQGQKLGEDNVAGLRKMLLAMVNDVRVVLIKLAERLCTIRVASKGKNCTMIAEAVMTIYAPLASRLGVSQIKWELEDLAFRCKQDQAYKDITKQLDERRLDREQYIQDFLQTLRDGLKKTGVQAEVAGRVKHIYSIWRKMQKKHVDFDRLFDIRAVRILVNDINDCYQALSFVHEIWQPVPEEFDDYIASPKPNGYRSIHTVVKGPGDKTIEIQVRTFKMHEDNEIGVAAHWRYKEGTIDTSLDNKINWLRSLLSWQQELGEHDDDLAVLKSQLIDERVYVFAPDGAVFDLPKGATPLDFAYLIHTDVGHRCRGAKVNGKMVQLTSQLQTGDRVEIITQKISQPSRDWLNEHEGYLATSKAQAKVAQWFRLQGRDGNIQAGKDFILKAARKLKITEVNHENLASTFNKKTLDELYISIGVGDIKWPSVLTHLEQLYGTKPEPEEKANVIAKPVKTPTQTSTQLPLVIGGVDNLMANMAGCCKPVVGDEVTGYITQGRGVTVHRANCRQIEVMRAKWPEKFIAVAWSEKQASKHKFAVDLRIVTHDRGDLLRDITTILSNEKILILGMHTQQSRKFATNEIMLTIEVDSSEWLKHIMSKLEQIPDVKQVKRV